jgi:hypothetical protein
MLNRSLIAWLSFTWLFGALGSYSYFYMEARLRELIGYKPKFLKYPTDLWEVYVGYRGLALQGKAPKWPAWAFTISFSAIVLSVLYLILFPKPFG